MREIGMKWLVNSPPPPPTPIYEVVEIKFGSLTKSKHKMSECTCVDGYHRAWCLCDMPSGVICCLIVFHGIKLVSQGYEFRYATCLIRPLIGSLFYITWHAPIPRVPH